MSSHHVLQGLLMAAKPRALVAAFQTVRQTLGHAAPDHRRSQRSYGAMAQIYELRTSSGDHGRRELVECLAPRSGEVILDVGCGSGRNFDQIRRRIGPSGRLIGVEPSPEMLAQARALVRRRGWTNVELICATAEKATIPTQVDAAILCAVHDVMRSPRALTNILGHVRQGGRIAAGGPKWVAWRPQTIALNLATWRLNRDCVSTFEGFITPWSRLAELVEDLHVDERYGGAGYVASARCDRADR
ncbi:class I SAM-dependent methyltransferase [Solirubrobacter ginsenosidimutans]|uniref:Class I SAM-dependent methyltransferase n=1 Tax=Solirubrobacter ginsenosidimutans TaxID=490573 RepID=A0A9X3MZE4_9ACTN|nr:class I SAM-dependent methyltransferase [Solirubrobacter ginsenosidimutans]MDA0165669.1 class I SAM-dependent methyltransferase [Solirubrobacter ginsenosidimutans]